MGTHFWWIFDCLVLTILVFFVYSNAKRGVSKVFVMSIGYIVATVLASLLSAVSAPTLYEVMALDSNIESIEKVNAEVDIAQCFQDAISDKRYGATFDKSKIESFLLPPDTDQFDKNLYQYVNKRCGYEVSTPLVFKTMLRDAFVKTYGLSLKAHLPDYAYANFEKMMEQDPTLIHTVLGQLYSNDNTAQAVAAYIENTFVREPTIEVFRIGIYLVLFSIMMLFAALLSAALEYRVFFNLYPVTDHLLGGLLGLLEATAILVLMTSLVRLMVLIGGGRWPALNDETIMKSKLFHYLYERLVILL